MKNGTSYISSILLGAAIIISVCSCGKKDSTPPPPPASSGVQTNDPSKNGYLTLLDFKIARNKAGNLALTGSVSNSSTEITPHAVATFKLLDKDGKEIGETVVTVDNLQAQFSWTFEAVLTNESTTSAKFIGFTTM